MYSKLTGSLLAIALLAPLGGMTRDVPVAMTLAPESKLWVEGGSTVRAWSCKATDIDASIDAAAEASSAVVKGEKAVRSVVVSIPSKGLDCENNTMNGHMLKAIKANEAPVIRYQLASYDLTPGASGAAVKLTGKLSLGGVERPISIDAQATEGPNGTLKVVGSKSFLMTEYGLKPPTLMMGTMKVRDQVTVKFDLALRP